MIIFCEECGARNIIDPEAAATEASPVRCVDCGDILRHPLLPAPAAAAVQPLGLLSPQGLELKLHNQVIMLNQTRPTATMGRQEHNDLEVIDTRVSRSHARIEYRQGQFVLIDHSTNGTYVIINGKKGYNLRREEMTLEGSGIITLGRKAPTDPSRAIHFKLTY